MDGMGLNYCGNILMAQSMGTYVLSRPRRSGVELIELEMKPSPL